MRVFTERETELAAQMPEKIRPDMSKFLLCPMPGLVVSLAVSEGQEVAAGDPLCVVEAMKMENVLKAERDAKVVEGAGQARRQPQCRCRDPRIRLSMPTEADSSATHRHGQDRGQGAGRVLSAPGPTRPRARLGSTARCATRVTARSKRCFQVLRDNVAKMLKLCEQGPRGRARDAKSRSSTRAARSRPASRCSAQTGADASVLPKISAKAERSASSTCAMSVSEPSAARLVTGVSSEPARHDAREMLQLRSDVEADAVQAHPVPHAHADAGDLGARQQRCRPAPSRRSPSTPRLASVAISQSSKRCDEGTDVAAAPGEIEHDIGHALAGAVIGEAPAAAGPEHRKSRSVEQFLRTRRWCPPCKGKGAPAATRTRLPRLARCHQRGRPWPPSRPDKAPARRLPAIRPRESPRLALSPV